MSSADKDCAPVIQALLAARRTGAGYGDLLKVFCRRLHALGVPLDRVSIHLRTLHPQILAHSLFWTSAEDEIRTEKQDFAMVSKEEFLDSPIPPVLLRSATIVEDLRQPTESLRFPLSRDLKRDGFTGYLALPLPFSDHVQVVSVATRAPDAFSTYDRARIDACIPALASVLETRLLQEMARNLLSTYVGSRAGNEVWDGSIRRGQGETVFAVVYTCDLRGFTAMAASLDLAETTRLLNTFFDAMGGPVIAKGGEILKFIGDGLLAVFPCVEGRVVDCAQADAAVEAAHEGLNALAAADHRSFGLDQPLSAGVALAIGQVLYGNIGVADRLDFTVVGPPVNMAARLQNLGAALGQPILMSAGVAERLSLTTRSLGAFDLKGVPEQQRVFAVT